MGVLCFQIWARTSFGSEGMQTLKTFYAQRCSSTILCWLATVTHWLMCNLPKDTLMNHLNSMQRYCRYSQKNPGTRIRLWHIAASKLASCLHTTSLRNVICGNHSMHSSQRISADGHLSRRFIRKGRDIYLFCYEQEIRPMAPYIARGQRKLAHILPFGLSEHGS